MSTSILSLKFVKGYWITMRPYLLFVSGITGIAGLSSAQELPVYKSIVLIIVFFFSYGFGQALTDCFQTDTDAISSPYRPIVKGEIKKKDVFAVSLVLLIGCGIVLSIFSFIDLLLALLCVLGLATYTYFKKRWWGGPFYNGWIVAVLFLIGYNSGIKNYDEYLTPNLIPALTAVLFGYANFVLVGYFKDVEADRRTGYNTFVVKWGRKKASIVSDIFASAFTLLGLLSVDFKQHFSVASELISYGFLLASIVVSVYTQVELHLVKSDSEAHRAVSASVHTYILMLSGMASFNKPEWIPFLIIFYLGFYATLKIRPEKTQI